MSEAVYTVEALSFAYPGQQARALDGVSFSVAPGGVVTLCGPPAGGRCCGS